MGGGWLWGLWWLCPGQVTSALDGGVPWPALMPGVFLRSLCAASHNFVFRKVGDAEQQVWLPLYAFPNSSVMCWPCTMKAFGEGHEFVELADNNNEARFFTLVDLEAVETRTFKVSSWYSQELDHWATRLGFAPGARLLATSPWQSLLVTAANAGFWKLDRLHPCQLVRSSWRF